jgi:hypothetical protein
MKEFKTKSLFLIKSINEVSGEDILKNKSRKRNVVEAKMVYIKKMRDFGYTYESIASELNMDHATAIYHFKNYNYILRSSNTLRLLDEKVTEYLMKNNCESIKDKISFLENEISCLKNLLNEYND